MAKWRKLFLILSIPILSLILISIRSVLWHHTMYQSNGERGSCFSSEDVCTLLKYCGTNSRSRAFVEFEHCQLERLKGMVSSVHTVFSKRGHSSNGSDSSSSPPKPWDVDSHSTASTPKKDDGYTVESMYANTSQDLVFKPSLVIAHDVKAESTRDAKQFPVSTEREWSKFHNSRADTTEEVIHGKRSTKYTLAVMVLSAPSGRDRRQVIRETWMRGHGSHEAGAVIKFVVGTLGLHKSEAISLDSEQAEYSDLVLLHTLKDDYNNLTRKVLYTLVWADENLHFSYLLKCDDDTFVRVSLLLSELRRRKSADGLYWGYFTGRNKPLRMGKWAEHSWFLCDHFLPFAMGGGYVISSDLVHRVASNADGVQLYSNEDTSVGVWLAPYKAERKHDTRFNTEGTSRGCSNHHLVSHKQSPEEMRSKHRLLLATGVQCKREIHITNSYQYNWHVPPSECCRKRRL